MSTSTHKYVAFLRGINVGGYHKVPMKELKVFLEKQGYAHVKTILNSGNIIFESAKSKSDIVEKELESLLETKFKFPIPTIVRSAEEIQNLLKKNPFKNVIANENLHLYVSFLKNRYAKHKKIEETNGFKIIEVQKDAVICVLDKTVTQSTKAMELLDKSYDKHITTRNWNTILRIQPLL